MNAASNGEQVTMFIEAVGWIAALLFFSAYLPQLVRTYQLKSVDDLSPKMWYTLLVAHCCMLFYGAELASDPMIFGSLLGINAVMIMLAFYYMYRDPRKDQIRTIVKGFLHDVKKQTKKNKKKK